MNILILNGSPKGEKSNTLKLSSAFLQGLNTNKNNIIQTITIAEKHIEPCLGCYSCWTRTPGKCVIKDNMAELIKKYTDADLIIWSFPLYYFSMPSKIKAFMDRLLPLNLPTITINEKGRGSHPSRYDLSYQRHILISTCGFYSTQGNFDALLQQFEILFGDKLTKIICPEGELFSVSYLESQTSVYLSHVKKAGEEFLSKGSFSIETQNKLNEPLYPPHIFVEMANANWDIETDLATKTEQSTDKSYRFIRQMAAIYNPQSYTKDIILEINFTDIDKTYQLILGSDSCIIKTDDFTSYTTRIETPFDIWLKISDGEISGAEAMMKNQYKVVGEFETMLKMDKYFGAVNPSTPDDVSSASKLKSPNMLILLFPFITLWVFLPLGSQIGGFAGIIAAATIPLLHCIWKPVIYERIGAFAVTLISIFALIYNNPNLQIIFPFFAFGVIWTATCFLKVPITSYYSCKGYGGESAFKNPLFIKTNRILTAMWGVTYLLLGIAALLTMGTPISSYWAIITNVPTMLLGAFTVWFSRWYPKYVASR